MKYILLYAGEMYSHGMSWGHKERTLNKGIFIYFSGYLCAVCGRERTNGLQHSLLDYLYVSCSLSYHNKFRLYVFVWMYCYEPSLPETLSRLFLMYCFAFQYVPAYNQLSQDIVTANFCSFTKALIA